MDYLLRRTFLLGFLMLLVNCSGVEAKENVPIKVRSWGALKTTVGCGFDPQKKKVYFTLNGELVHEATLKSADFGNPLYPTVASNYDVTILVNFGQRTFDYVPANIGRVANPSCGLLQARSSKNGTFFDDSGDMFSMGGLDSQWLSELEYTNAQELQHRHVLSEAESDLFEIVLDGHTLKK